MMAAYLMRTKDAVSHGESDGPVMRGYLWLVGATTKVRRSSKRRWLALPTYYLTLVVAVIVVILSVIAMLQVPGSLFPPEDESRIVVSVELPPGSTLDDTTATTDAMRELVMDIDGVKSVLVIGGSTPLGERDIRRATFTIILDRLDNGLARKLSDLGKPCPDRPDPARGAGPGSHPSPARDRDRGLRGLEGGSRCPRLQGGGHGRGRASVQL